MLQFDLFTSLNARCDLEKLDQGHHLKMQSLEALGQFYWQQIKGIDKPFDQKFGGKEKEKKVGPGDLSFHLKQLPVV